MKKKIVALLTATIFSITVIPASVFAEAICNHEWTSWIVSEPDCGNVGYKSRFCPLCDTEEVIRLEATGNHVWNEWENTEDPGCSSEGLKIRDCVRCYKIEKESIPAIGAHKWGNWEISEKPTCYYKGLAFRWCSLCDAYEDKDLPLIPHTWGSWKVYKKATALAKGKNVRYCTECDKAQYKETPKLKATVKLYYTSIKIKKGKSFTLKIKSRTYGDKIKKWTTSNKYIATVSTYGKVTGKKKGTATVTLYMQSGAKVSCKVTVK